jgi:type I restriction enzyme S subunit
MSDSQKMNEITDQGADVPDEWMWCNLGEIAVAQSGFACGEKNVQDGLIHLRMNNISENCYLNMELIRKVPLDNKIEKYLLKKCDLLFCHTNSSKLVGKNAIFNLNGDYTYSNHLTRLRVNPSIFSPKWLWCILTIYWKEGRFENECKNWVNQSALPHNKLIQLSIPLPPITEQHFIVDCVEKLLEHVTKAKESLDKIPLIMKRFRQAALKKAFSGELTAEWRAQQQNLEPAAELLKRIHEEQEGCFQTKAEKQKQSKKPIKPENEPIDTYELPELPEEWVWTNVGQMTDSMKNGIYKPIEFYKEDGIACLRMYNIDVGKIVWKNIKRMNLTKEEVDEYLLVPGDLLVNRVNSRELVGKAAVIPLEIEKCVFESKNIRVRVIDKIVNPRYLCYRFTSAGSEYFNRNAQQVVGMASISQPQIARFSVPLPPLPEQQEIVRRIESLFKFADETEKNAAEARKRVEIMTQSILARAFRGDLSADFRGAVRNWKDLDVEVRGRYVFVLPEAERQTVLNGDEFPMEPASRLLERIGEEKGKIIKGVKS